MRKNPIPGDPGLMGPDGLTIGREVGLLNGNVYIVFFPGVEADVSLMRMSGVYYADLIGTGPAVYISMPGLPTGWVEVDEVVMGDSKLRFVRSNGRFYAIHRTGKVVRIYEMVRKNPIPSDPSIPSPRGYLVGDRIASDKIVSTPDFVGSLGSLYFFTSTISLFNDNRRSWRAVLFPRLILRMNKIQYVRFSGPRKRAYAIYATPGWIEVYRMSNVK